MRVSCTEIFQKYSRARVFFKMSGDIATSDFDKENNASVGDNSGQRFVLKTEKVG